MLQNVIRRAGATVLIALALTWASTATAQDRAWIQIEAQPTAQEARARIDAYSQTHSDLAGFRLQTGWHAIVIGPYASRDAANAARLALRRDNLIPFDSFVTEGDSFVARYWPEGADPLPTREASEAPAPAELPDEEAAPEPEPEETLAQARQSEAALSRDERAALQTALQWFGHYDLAIDGAIGPGTRQAMRDWQQQTGLEPTGVLTTRQRARLLEAYDAERAELGLQLVRNDAAGIEIMLPTAMLASARTNPPFVQYDARDDSGIEVLLISRAGGSDTLAALFEIMQSLEIVPPEGQRELRSDSFLLTGRDSTRRSHTFARLERGQVKGYTLVWPPEQDARMERALQAMEDSFEAYGEALGAGDGTAGAISRDAMLAGLDMRAPSVSRSGFFVSDTGATITTTEVLESCTRLTLDMTHEARAEVVDDTLGVALLVPQEPLAPLAHASFRRDEVTRSMPVTVSGFSYGDALSRPVLSRGALGAPRGLNGEDHLARLSVQTEPGDAGAPVIDRDGAVIGMLQAPAHDGDRILPDEVTHAVQARALVSLLQDAGLDPAQHVAQAGPLTPEALNDMARDLSVLVSCWE